MIEATESNCVLLGYDKFGHPLYKAIEIGRAHV